MLNVPFESEFDVERAQASSQFADQSHVFPVPDWQRYFHVSDIEVSKIIKGDRRVYVFVIGGRFEDGLYDLDSLDLTPEQDRGLILKAAVDIKTEPDTLGFFDFIDTYFGFYETLRCPKSLEEVTHGCRRIRLSYDKRPVDRFVIFVLGAGESAPQLVIPLMIDYLDSFDDKLLLDSASNKILSLWEENDDFSSDDDSKKSEFDSDVEEEEE